VRFVGVADEAPARRRRSGDVIGMATLGDAEDGLRRVAKEGERRRVGLGAHGGARLS
jgi:hypothetical protein